MGSRLPCSWTCVRSQPRSGAKSPVARPGRIPRLGALGRGEELGGGHRPEGVGREVAPGAARPVDVLQAAEAVVRNGEPEQAAHAVVERPRQVGERQVAGDQRGFEVVAQQDVGRIGRLVGVHPDEAGLDPRLQAVEVLGREGGAVAAELRPHQGREEREERAAAAGLHLDDERLALVQAHAAGLADGLVAPCGRAALLVERMAGLVQHAHQRPPEIGLVVTGGDPYVVRGAAAERVQADIEAPAAEVEPERLHQRQPDPLLRVHRERTVQRQRRGLARLPLPGRRHQPGQPGAQLGEERVDGRAAHAGIVLVEQRVVSSEPERRPLDRPDLALEPQHLGQVRQQQAEIRLRAGFAPDHLGLRGRARTRLDEVARHRSRVGVDAAHLGEVFRLPRIEPLLAGGGERVGGLGRGQDLVGEAAQGRELVGAAVGGAVRHQGLGIPAEDAGGVADRIEAGEAAFETGIGVHDARASALARRPREWPAGMAASVIGAGRHREHPA